MAEFVMPSLGADMQAGTLVGWLKRPGDHVERGDIVAEVDTDKGVIEVEVFVGGTIERLLVDEGSKVPVGTPLAIIREEAASPAPAERLRISPSARRRAEELGVDAASLTGSGPSGAVTLEDVEKAGAGRGAGAEQERMRQAVAEAVSRSKREIPHYYVAHTVDVSALDAWLAHANAERSAPDRVLPAAAFSRATALALRDYPELNGWYEGGKFTSSSEIHVGTAIALRSGGLVIATLRDVDRCSLDDVMKGLRGLVERARRGQLRSSDLSGATITVTSLGERGVDSVFGVIYPPQVALVGFGAVRPRPWVDGAALVVRPLVEVTLSADHRVSDGHRGARFLAAIAGRLTRPETL